MTIAEQTAPAPTEIVDTESVPAVPADQERAAAAIVAASEAAMANPGAPGRDEFLMLATQARMLCLSGAAPKAIRNNPYVAFHVAMVGRDLGISPSAALELIDVIDGQNGPRLSLSPQLINGQIRRLGLGSIVPAVQTAERCIAVALGPHGKLDVKCKPTYPVHADGCGCVDIIGDYEWTWQDAQMAELAGAECTPGNHSPKCGNKDSARRLKCSQGNKTYPKRMHWWRASGYLADDVYPEAGMGLYTAEELGAAVDDEGRAIDVASVELPEGYETKAIGAATQELADADERWQLTLRMLALPEAQATELRETWRKSDKVGRVETLTVGAIKIAQAMVAGAESKARSANRDWSSAAAIKAVARSVVSALMPPWSAEPSDSPPSQPDPPKSAAQPAAGTETTPEAETAPETAPSAPSPPSESRKRGEAAVEPTEADLEGASPKLINDTITEVLAMHAPDVDKELTLRGLHTEGELDSRKRRLTLAKIRDAKASTQP